LNFDAGSRGEDGDEDELEMGREGKGREGYRGRGRRRTLGFGLGHRILSYLKTPHFSNDLLSMGRCCRRAVQYEDEEWNRETIPAILYAFPLGRRLL